MLNERFKRIRKRLFPGETFREIIYNEFQDFFVSGLFRKEFFVMMFYSVILMAVVFSAVIFFGQFDGNIVKVISPFFALSVYFIASDLFKRKKILQPHLHYFLDSIFFVGLMGLIIFNTGGLDSPIRYSLLFLTAVSAPLYGTMTEAVIFMLMVAGFQVFLGYYDHGFAFQLAYDALDGASWLTAAVIIRLTLNQFEKKNAALALAQQDQERLNKEIAYNNMRLETMVKERTKELNEALTVTRASAANLGRQKLAIMNILDDINEEKAATILEKEKMARILQSIGDAVFVIDKEKKIILFNHVAERVSGYLAGEVIGKRYDQIIKFVFERDGTPNRTVDEVYRVKRILELTGHTMLITKDGTRVPVADSAAPIINPSGEMAGCIVVFRDVTRDREIDRQKTEFVSVASHQLRTPLTSIKWFLEMMIDGDLGKLSEEQIETLKQIFESNERMIDLVNKLLNVSRIESGRVRVEPKPTNLNDLADSIKIELTPLVAGKKLKFEVRLPTLPVINIDPKLIREVMMNFLSNAIKYTPENGSVILNAEVGQFDITFCIKDTGMGIPLDQQVKVFHKFFRADNAVAKETEGTGMGLYVAKSIIELSGGRVWFESKQDKGTTFYFTLPLAGSKAVEGERGLI